MGRTHGSHRSHGAHSHSSKTAPPPSPYSHFRTLLSTACVPCLVNTPHPPLGLHRVKRGFPVNSSAMLPTPPRAPHDLLRALGIGIPSSHTLSSSLSRYRDLMKPEDSVVRAVLNGFVELGKGTVHHVVLVAGERGWLDEMGGVDAAGDSGAEVGGWGRQTLDAQAQEGEGGRGQQVVLVTREEREREQMDKGRRGRARSASLESVDRHSTHHHAYANNATNVAAYARAGYITTTTPSEHHNYDLDDDLGDYDYDSELDSELDLEMEMEMDADEEGAVGLEMTVKEMALTDWARGRILDGTWAAPADVYFGNRVNGLGRNERAMGVDVDAKTRRPGAPVPIPPMYRLTEAAHIAHCKQLRIVLLPAFRNVVRRVIVECALDAAEANAAADVVIPDTLPRRTPRYLRAEEHVWFGGIDWREARKNARDQERERAREWTHRSEGSGDSCAGTPPTSDTSPMLSTSTPGTTPSPPPLGEHDLKEKDVRRRELPRQTMIVVAPHLRARDGGAAGLAGWEPDSGHDEDEVCTRCDSCPARKAEGQKKDTEGPLVMHIPAEDKMDVDGRGAESVVSLVEDDGACHGRADHGYQYHSGSEDGLEGLTAQEWYWLQVEEEEGPGAFERERELEDGDGDPFALGLFATQGRKRSVEELGGDGDVHQDEARRRTPPKRARIGAKTTVPAVRLVKRRSEELDVGTLSAETGL
ncbi:hypothetical protein C8R47DRAFT_1230943 [Mycena vitilis]|nr:hypothetical protein C8R47DRAFT_1230943 [Mycena vitilis]